jgi:uncharacterized protein affecting Mg2+/Co2+ transport
MKLNSTVALTLILLAMMLGAGFVSAMWGFALGHEALKGVTQPDIRPTKKLADKKATASGKEGVPILREEDILVNVNEYINSKSKEPKTDNSDKTDKKDEQADNNSQSKAEAKSSPQPSATQASFTTSTSSDQNLPVKSQDQGVTLEVRSASQQGNSLLLNVSMKNDGSNPVRFLYSFLNVTDDQGRALSAITEGLPGELPANGKEFTGTVSIPTALLEDAKKLSLTLTDYPDQKLQLKMSEIPVKR